MASSRLCLNIELSSGDARRSHDIILVGLSQLWWVVSGDKAEVVVVKIFLELVAVDIAIDIEFTVSVERPVSPNLKVVHLNADGNR